MKGRVKSLTFEEAEGSFPLPYTACYITVAVTDLKEAAQTFAPGTKIDINVETEENPT